MHICIHMTKYILSLIITILASLTANAFAPDTYAGQSVLGEGRWVKVSVAETGLHVIPTATLRQWGFSDPARVRVYGYGGRRIDDVMTLQSYIDDLPCVASQLTDAGLVFYGVGPDQWVLSTGAHYHRESSPYTSYGYYFLTEGSEPAPSVPVSSTSTPATADNAVSTGRVRLHYEKDLVQASESGPLFVGEDLRNTRTRNFSFATPGRADGTEVWMECQVMHHHVGGAATVSFSVDGSKLAAMSTDKIPATTDSHYNHGSVGVTRNTFRPSDTDSFVLEMTYTPSQPVTKAHLDYISVDYIRNLAFQSGEKEMEFSSNASLLKLDAPGKDVVIWDVTNPLKVAAMAPIAQADGSLVWAGARRGGLSDYVVWNSAEGLPVPALVGKVANQNLHADTDTPDYIIISAPAYNTQAERIAALHRAGEGLEVKIVDPAKIYNEFSSGARDVSGIRKYLKMMYDRGLAAGRPLRYVLLMGRATLDHRQILESTSRLSPLSVPWWVVREPRKSMSDNDGFGTDDFVAMLKDGSGGDLGLDDLSVAVGRLPLLSPEDGNEIIDKLYNYVNKARKSSWKNRLLLLCDDEDQGVHLRQTEAMANLMEATRDQQHLLEKIYIDAYPRSNGTYPQARTDMFRILDEGVAWWFYVGHANNHSWTGDGMLTYTDINSMYLRNVPFVVAATCDFLRWDSETISGGEIMYKERYGGAIGMISATRPVYISDNAYFLNAMGRHTLERDDAGCHLAAGEVYRRAKNDILNSRGEHASNSNRLRFVFMGDPAMRLSTPDNTVRLTAADGVEITEDAQITLAAMANVELTGCIVDADGVVIDDFNGVVSIEIFDAERSVTTYGHGNGKVEAFDTHGDKLFAGATKVEGGRFTIRVAMPGQVADNFRPAAVQMYAYATDSDLEAIGNDRRLYVYGFREPDQADTTPPAIDSFVLNHSGFTDGATVNCEPMIIAHVSDNVGLNLSQSGIGHQMTLQLDGKTTFSDVSSYYTPDADGSAAGTINYPLDGLSKGAHELTLRVFDTSGNSSSRTVTFTAADGIAPQIFEVFTDTNPAVDHANFYVRHDRPENIVEVFVTVYNLMGRPVWSSSAKGVSDSDLSTPVVWNLCDAAGRRVPRGIYLYRATITTDNANYETASRRIAVAAE